MLSYLDNFDVIDNKSPNNLFKKYGIKRENDKSYMHEIKMLVIKF